MRPPCPFICLTGPSLTSSRSGAVLEPELPAPPQEDSYDQSNDDDASQNGGEN